eukprot:357925-Chlamydomonas_euryale.AAC.3
MLVAGMLAAAATAAFAVQALRCKRCLLPLRRRHRGAQAAGCHCSPPRDDEHLAQQGGHAQ